MQLKNKKICNISIKIFQLPIKLKSNSLNNKLISAITETGIRNNSGGLQDYAKNYFNTSALKNRKTCFKNEKRHL